MLLPCKVLASPQLVLDYTCVQPTQQHWQVFDTQFGTLVAKKFNFSKLFSHEEISLKIS